MSLPCPCERISRVKNVVTWASQKKTLAFSTQVLLLPQTISLHNTDTMNETDNPYRILGLRPNATEADIKKAYRTAARKYHPDKQTNDEDRQKASDVFAKVSAAYDTLTDPVKRYDWRMNNSSRLSSPVVVSPKGQKPKQRMRQTTQRPNIPASFAASNYRTNDNSKRQNAPISPGNLRQAKQSRGGPTPPGRRRPMASVPSRVPEPPLSEESTHSKSSSSSNGRRHPLSRHSLETEARRPAPGRKKPGPGRKKYSVEPPPPPPQTFLEKMSIGKKSKKKVAKDQTMRRAPVKAV